MVMLSAVDGPPGLRVVAVHGPGGPSMTAACGPGRPIEGGTIGCVTDQISQYWQHNKYMCIFDIMPTLGHGMYILLGKS